MLGDAGSRKSSSKFSKHLWQTLLRQVDPNLGAGLGTPSAARLMPGGGGGCDGLPAVNRAYNLYQPYDPIAYRCGTPGCAILKSTLRRLEGSEQTLCTRCKPA